jgi:hypothetical protein
VSDEKVITPEEHASLIKAFDADRAVYEAYASLLRRISRSKSARDSVRSTSTVSPR